MINLTWKEIEEQSIKIAKKIKKDYRPDAIIGISSGGLIPTVIISKMLKIKKIGVFTISSYDNKKQKKLQILSKPKIDLKDKKVLLIDDICDTGNTLDYVKKELLTKYKCKEIRVAVLVVNQEHTKKENYPKYYYKKIKDWIHFPWEINE